MMLLSRFKVAAAIIFYLISPSSSFLQSFTPPPTIRAFHRVAHPGETEFIFSRNNEYRRASPSPYYASARSLGFRPIAAPVFPAAPYFPFAAVAPLVPAAPVAPVEPIAPVVPEIVTDAPTLPPATEAPVVITTTTAAPTTLPPPTTTAAPAPVETPAPIVEETPAPIVEETPAPIVEEAPATAAPAPVAPEAPVEPAAPVAPAAPQIITIQQQPEQGGFPRGIIAVQPIITGGGILNLGSGRVHFPAGQPNFQQPNLLDHPAFSLLEALLAQRGAAAAPAPEVTQAPTTAAPETTAAPVMTTTVLPETTAAPVATEAPRPYQVPVLPVFINNPIYASQEDLSGNSAFALKENQQIEPQFVVRVNEAEKQQDAHDIAVRNLRYQSGRHHNQAAYDNQQNYQTTYHGHNNQHNNYQTSSQGHQSQQYLNAAPLPYGQRINGHAAYNQGHEQNENTHSYSSQVHGGHEQQYDYSYQANDRHASGTRHY